MAEEEWTSCPTVDTVRSWHGRTLVGRDGGRIGPIEASYLDDRTGQPEWALVNTGLFGTKSSLVPLVGAVLAGRARRRRAPGVREALGRALGELLAVLQAALPRRRGRRRRLRVAGRT